MRGPPPKDPELRQRRNKPKALALVRPGPAAVPDPPDRLLKVTSEAWQEFWKSELAGLVNQGSDLLALRRLFTLYDLRERAYRNFRRHMITVGSTGQDVLNPLHKVMTGADSEIRSLEDRFGLTPMSRLRLGVQLGEAKKSLDRLNAELDADDDDDDPRATHDPRVVDAT